MSDTGRAGGERLADRFRGALLGVAIGDALGAPLEGGAMRERAELSSWVEDPPEPLRYTDDTHMTIATARSLVERGGFDGAHMAEALTAQYESEPWRGYGPGPPEVFAGLRAGKAWDEAARSLFAGAGSFGNGGAMRVAPAGLLYYREPGRAADVARRAASITHAHPIGQGGAGVVAAAVAEVLRTPPDAPLHAETLIEHLREHTTTRRLQDLLDPILSLRGAPESMVVQILGNGIEAHRSVPTALHAFCRHPDSFADAVLFALSLGGDADTIASMAGALAGARHGASGIPEAWTSRVEGRDELLSLADALLALATR